MPPGAGGRVTPGIYVTGTDTGVGKTLASAALLHALRGQGLRANGMKPVASGCVRTVDGWRNDDALALLAAGEPGGDYGDTNPYALPAATAPQLAAREAGVAIDPARLQAAWHRLAARSDAVVVEGVGGWLAPLSDDLDQPDLVRMLDLPVVMVVGLRLGCLSHARLTARAVAAEGCWMPGWIGSAVDPAFERRDDYLVLLERALAPLPCLGVLPWSRTPDPQALSVHLCLPPALTRCATGAGVGSRVAGDAVHDRREPGHTDP